MSALIRDGAIAVDDVVVLADDAPVPESGRSLISWERWQSERATLLPRAQTLGVLLPNTLDVVAHWTALAPLGLITLQFPAFADGRAYSQARLLRDRLGFKGELRATGNAVVRDQMQSLHRSGFNSFVLRADQDAAQCVAALNEFTLAYERAADDLNPVRARRRSAA